MKTSIVLRLFVLPLVLAFGILTPLQAQKPEAQFQQGLIKEEGEGSLQEAIEIYIEIAADESAGRPLQATAMLHIGLCYEKLGRQEAEIAYRNLINKFPDQTETVKIAREKLSLLAQTTVITRAESNEFRIRKVWEGTENLLGKTSPDERFLSFTDWETGDLAVYDLVSGKNQRLTHKGTWDDCSDYAEDSRWSPDGRQIAYGWCDDTGAYDLRIIGLDGSGPEIIYKNDRVNYLIPCDWSPDGKQVLAILNYEDRTAKAALISVPDGSVNVLRSSADWPGKICLSKDGHYMLYDEPQMENSRVRDIYLLPIKGGNKIPLVQNPADDFLLDITPDGKHVLFSSDRDGTLGLYVIQLDEGKPKGEPVLVRSSMGQIENLGCTPTGSFYYGVSKESSDVYIGELDPESGNIIKPWTKMKTRFQGNNREPDYAPDGKHLAYISVINPSVATASGYTRGGDMLMIRSLDTQQETNIVPELTHMGFPIWLPDSKSVMVVEWAERSSMGMHRINVETGQMETIINPDTGLIRLFGRHGLSPDGNTLFYGLLSKDFSSFQIMSRDLESGKDHGIYESNDVLHLSLSPDGSQLAILSRSRMVRAYAMHVIPASGGKARELFRFNKDENMDIAYSCSCIWSKDGTYILFLLKDGNVENPNWELCRIPATGGQIEKLIKVPGQAASSLSMHPDGRHIAFSSTSTPLSPAVWVMENFLPSD